ncbi:MAG: TrkH family potassium uptake protein [Lachnospiraceae bacterium]|nr:TrkH family potassium uptake protein [Lachnospiraceae bacterium]MDY5741459.1 TrkH family potassium uptake protein [Lachnospiraceae bacterium]
MNKKMILHILGRMLQVEAALLLLPLSVGLWYRDDSVPALLGTMIASAALGTLISWKKPENSVLFVRDGFIATATSWMLLSLIGSMPFFFSGYIPNLTDAVFETVSGFTTTGSSILTDVEALPHGLLFWRSFTHWIGGMGVLVFVLAVIPLLGGGQNLHLMRAESPGPKVGKLVPNLRKTAIYLYMIYTIMTVAQIILLLLSGMPLFDAVTLSFGSAGTGGFGIRNNSIAGYTTLQQLILTIAMILFGVNFQAYFLIATKKAREIFHLEEVRWYFIIILSAIAMITAHLTIRDGWSMLGNNLHHVAFTVGSIITTTGYATVDFETWTSFAKTVLVMLMFIGACAGSTGGGIKISRIIIYFKSIRKELHRVVHPRRVKVLQLDGHVVNHDTQRSINVFLALYFMLVALSILVVSLDGKDLITNFTAVAATINNIGPGLAVVGPTGNFSSFSLLSKWVFIFDMLVGRLELFPLVILFTRSAWGK